MARRKKIAAPPPLYPSTRVEDGALRDGGRNSRPLKRGARVYVPPRTNPYSGGFEVSGWGGTVVNIRLDHEGREVVDIRENGTRALRSRRPADCKVQYGQTKASIEAAAAAQEGT